MEDLQVDDSNKPEESASSKATFITSNSLVVVVDKKAIEEHY